MINSSMKSLGTCWILIFPWKRTSSKKRPCYWDGHFKKRAVCIMEGVIILFLNVKDIVYTDGKQYQIPVITYWKYYAVSGRQIH